MHDYSLNVCTGEGADVPRAGDEHGAGGAALTTAHISPQGKVQLFMGASYIKVSKHLVNAPAAGGGIRGRATFSKASRRRMLRELSKVRRDALPLFLGLTYPAEWPGNPTVWKKHLDNFWKRVVRRWPEACCIWKLEPQKRGAPHYHLLVWNVPFADFNAWGRVAWHEIVGSDDGWHLIHGFELQEIKSVRQCFAYASKYIGKALEDGLEGGEGWSWTDGGVGRFWGIRGHIETVMGVLAEVALTYPEACRLLRLLRRAIHAKGRDYPSLTGIVDADFWISRLDQLISA